MGAFEDLSGKKFGRLMVIGQSHRDSFNKIRWRCVCDCGNENFVITSYLKNGRIKSCGCLHKETSSRKFKTHGLSRLSEYRLWAGMIQRCTNKRNNRYMDYGGRGITVCERWMNKFEAFYEDMGPRPSPYHSIERKDNERGYSPDNCKWATDIEQRRNKRVRKSSSTGVKGVIWYKRSKKWRVYFTVNKKYTYVGQFDNLEDAIEARRQAEIKYWNKQPS